MKALSIRNPWAWLIVNGHKPIENRSWKTNYCGPIAIHAGKACGVDEREAWEWVRENFPQIDMPPLEKMQFGALVGTATIVDCVNESTSPWFFGEYGFVLSEARPCAPVKMAGKLNLFEIDDSLVLPTEHAA